MHIHAKSILTFIAVCLGAGPPSSCLAEDQQLVIAHRGASGYLPEHTLEAASFAHAAGAHYIEQDVVLSKDNRPIVLHDIHLDTVTNVAEVFPETKRHDGRFYAIDLTLAEIRQLRVTERIDLDTGKAAYPGRFPPWSANFEVPTLAEEIELIQGLNKSTGRRVGIYTEIKSPAWHREQGKDISPIVLEVLARYGYRNRGDAAYVQCFDAAETQRLREELRCDLKLIQLISARNWKTSADAEPHERLTRIAQYADGIGPPMSLVVTSEGGDKALTISPLVAAAHRVGLHVHPYTLRADTLPEYVDTFERLLDIFFMRAGVDGAFTDFPGPAAEFLRHRRVRGSRAQIHK